MPRVPVFADSPMAIKAVQVFLKHTEEFSDETRRLIAQYGSPLEWEGFHFAATQEESKKINEQRMPCIVVSANVRGRDLALLLPDSPLEAVMSNEVWENLYDRLAELISTHHTTLIFANTRRLRCATISASVSRRSPPIT